MQCASCSAQYSSDQAVCPQCQKPASSSEKVENNIQVSLPLDNPAPEESAAGAQTPPTLIEFPGVSARRQQPQWRKDLCERVRVIQERRAHESNHAGARTRAERATKVKTADAGVPRLVPHVDPPPVNPIVAAALRRAERARESARCPSTEASGEVMAERRLRSRASPMQPKKRHTTLIKSHPTRLRSSPLPLRRFLQRKKIRFRPTPRKLTSSSPFQLNQQRKTRLRLRRP